MQSNSRTKNSKNTTTWLNGKVQSKIGNAVKILLLYTDLIEFELVGLKGLAWWSYSYCKIHQEGLGSLVLACLTWLCRFDLIWLDRVWFRYSLVWLVFNCLVWLDHPRGSSTWHLKFSVWFLCKTCWKVWWVNKTLSRTVNTPPNHKDILRNGDIKKNLKVFILLHTQQLS